MGNRKQITIHTYIGDGKGQQRFSMLSKEEQRMFWEEREKEYFQRISEQENRRAVHDEKKGRRPYGTENDAGEKETGV